METQKTNLLDETVDEINKFKDLYSKEFVEDEEIKDPANILFNEISETSIHILQDPAINNCFAEIAKELKEETVRQLVTVIGICMTHSAYQAITFYDELLKAELSKQFDNLSHHINLCKTDDEAIKASFSILRKQFDEVKNEIINKQFPK
jgi:predicted aminopeptidase